MDATASEMADASPRKPVPAVPSIPSPPGIAAPSVLGADAEPMMEEKSMFLNSPHFEAISPNACAMSLNFCAYPSSPISGKVMSYIGILADMSRGNDGVLEQLSRLSGISTESISYLNATKGAFEDLGAVTLEGLEESIGGIGESASTLSTSAGEASAAAGNIQESVRNMSQSIAPLNTELGNLKTLIGELIALLNDITFPEIGEEGYAQKLMDIAQAFGEIASKCGEFKNIDFSSIIGSASAPSTDGAAMPGGEGMEGAAGTGFLGLASAISEAVSSIDEQMGKLKTALDSGNSYFTGQIDVINEKYIPAWENLRTRLAEIIGVEGGDSEDKEGRGKQKAGSTDGGSASGGKPGSIIDIMQTGGGAGEARHVPALCIFPCLPQMHGWRCLSHVGKQQWDFRILCSRIRSLLPRKGMTLPFLQGNAMRLRQLRISSV